MFKATLNSVSVISWQSVLLGDKMSTMGKPLIYI